jgi:uncharacterized protein (DUF2147 family)
MKKFILGLLCLLSFTSAWAAADIVGFWKTVDDKTGKAQSVVAIYQYKNDYYGRMIGSYNADGVMDDTIYTPKVRATALPGEPYYSGMDFIWALDKRGSVYKGEILDPEHGDVYKAEVWVDQGNLIVRGKLMMFGRNQTWPPATKKDFPAGFKMPDTSKFVPVAPVDDLMPQLQ